MIYAIGDVHGQHQKLQSLLDKLESAGMAAEDTLVFVGDYVDRGPDSAGVIQTLIDLKQSRSNTVFLRGNHEQMMLDARQKFERSFDSNNTVGNCDSGIYWFPNGGEETLKSYGPKSGLRWYELVPESHWHFLLATEMEYRQLDYIFVHAGIVPPGKRWDPMDFKADPRLWIRYEFIASESDFGGHIVIFGHTPTRDGKPMILWNKVALDTGAGYGGPVTAIRLPDRYDMSSVMVYQSD